jgi:predicted dehydrogenase
MTVRGKNKLRVGILGTGWPGRQHALALKAGDEGELHSCAELGEERRAEFEKAFGPRKSFRDYGDLLKDPELDAAIICLPNFLHFPASLAALEAGKHVFCEKPPTLNSAEMKVLREEGARRGLVYFFGRQFRFTPAMRTAKEMVANGRLGNIYYARATFVRSRGIPVGIGAWFTEKRRSGGGALIDIGIHALDSAWYLMETPRPISVTAGVFRNFEHLVRVPVFDVEDAAYAFIRFEGGAVVQLEVSWAGNLTDDIPIREPFGREKNNSIVYGTKGTIQLHPLSLFEDRDGVLERVPITPRDDQNGFELQMKNFLQAVAGTSEPVNNADQAVALMEMVDAIYASSASGREVPIVQS